MKIAGSALRSQTFDSKGVLRLGLTPATLRNRATLRRIGLAGQLISYTLGATILLLYVRAGVVPITIPASFVLAGATIIAIFLALSETHVSDRFTDHHLVVPQVAAHSAIQFAFLIAAPQIGYAFLSVLFLIFVTGSLRMTSRQATLAWLLMTAGAAPILMLMNVPISMAVATPIERTAALLCFIATIAQCTFVGLYGNSLRRQLYKSSVELKLAYSRIEELADLDELTGALNRRCIMKLLDDEITAAHRNGTPCSIALIDLDLFKRINDLFGHATGDEVLRSFSIAVFANIRPGDKFGRYGGEEFLLVLPETGEDAALRLLDRLRVSVADLDWTALSPGVSVTISGSVVTLRDDEAADVFLARADRALRAAKRAGRNRIETSEAA